MPKARKYLRIDEAQAAGYLSRPALRQQRLRPTADTPWVEYWQGYTAVRAYLQSACAPMRPARPATARQLAALELGRCRCPHCGRVSPVMGPDGTGELCEPCQDAADRRRQREADEEADWQTVVAHARAAAVRRARMMLDDPYLLIFDTETTGLDSTAEIVEIGIVDRDGQPVYHSLVRPQRPIPAEASEIHGITDQDVAAAPCFADIAPHLGALFAGRQVAAYNAEFDVRLLRQSGPGVWPWSSDERWARCVMKLFSRWLGEWSAYHGGWRWHRLGHAAEYTGYKGTGQAHRALEDARMAAHVLRAIAADRRPPTPWATGS